MIKESFFSKPISGESFEIEVEIGETVKGTEWFETPVRISILDPKARPIYGVSAIHSLQLALLFVTKMLDDHTKKGNILHLKNPFDPNNEDQYIYSIRTDFEGTR